MPPLGCPCVSSGCTARAACVRQAKSATWSRAGAPRATGRSSTPALALSRTGPCWPIVVPPSGRASGGPPSAKSQVSTRGATRAGSRPAAPAHHLPSAAPCVPGTEWRIPLGAVLCSLLLAVAILIMESTLASQCRPHVHAPGSLTPFD